MQHPKSATFNLVFNPSPAILPNHNIRSKLERELNHSFNFQALKPILPTTPPWLFLPPTVNLSLTKHQKKSTPASTFTKLFQELIHSFQNPTVCFTDGSKNNNTAGFAYLIQNSLFSYRHRNTASVYTTELQAIFNCLESIISHTPQLPPNPYLVVTDSLAALNAISVSSTHPLVTRIHILLQSCSMASIQIIFIWAPGHTGIQGNEKVDKAAKHAARHKKIPKSALPTSTDLFAYIKKFIKKQWFTNWQDELTKRNKLAQLKDTPTPWSSSNLQTRSQEITLTRLRIGHTRLTHNYLISDLMPPSCPHCNIISDIPLTVSHIFQCPNLKALRTSHNIPHNRIAALADDSATIHEIFTYLKQAGFLSRI